MITIKPLLLGTLILSPSLAYSLTAQDILAKADAVRMPSGDVYYKAKLLVIRSGVQEQGGTYEILCGGRDKTVIKTLLPASDRGTSFLMLGRDLWVFLPDLSKPIRMALQQRLMGEISNGDLARANFVGDYTPSIAKESKTFYELKLVAVSEDVTYSQVRLWVDKETFRPMRAAFYASSGRLLKIGHYEEFRLMEGVMRPGRLVFEDAVQKNKKSVILYEDLKTESYEPKLFTKDYLKKLKY